MGNRADEEGTDVEFYRKPLTDTVHADTPTGAPAQLLDLLDRLGFERKTVETAGPVYVWHEAPADLSEDGKKRLATRALPTLLLAGYVVHIPDDLFDPAAYEDAVSRLRTPSTSSTPGSVPTSMAGAEDRAARRR
ncbi:hypothetical protein [Streptomyces neyagawaensis]|uniref:hypothetical protein n=1 Tax=Streptomyces neyagawaensis TaxID=42238 RepID=UPI0006E29EF6|nr:hypothetical protein [Streptomyces neyagawaensis]MCL6737727.1 hypothetical protein [Streptomyces neyagawaensis]MDE1687718.1 hypothetical protein [Streptomyces neyagawaensis]MDG5808478.1 hypothetical protein [Streptomyces ossamyceticus]